MSGSTAILAYHPIARHLPRCDPVRSILAQMYQVFKPPAPSGRAIAFGFLEAPLKGKLLLPTADLGDSVPLLQDVKANKPENTAGNYKCRPRKFQMRLPCTVRGPVAPAQANRHSRAGGSPTGDRRFCPKSTPTAKSILIPPFDSPAHPCYRFFMTPAHSLSALSAYSAVTQSPCHRDVTVVARNVTSKSRQCLGHVTARQASPKLNVPKWHQVSRDAAMFYWSL